MLLIGCTTKCSRPNDAKDDILGSKTLGKRIKMDALLRILSVVVDFTCSGIGGVIIGGIISAGLVITGWLKQHS